MIILQVACAAIAFLLFIYSLSMFSVIQAVFVKRNNRILPCPPPADWPRVTIQLPVYQDKLVVERLLESVSRIEYPRECLEVQILDDSTDETSQIIDRKAVELVGEGLNVRVVRRADRRGYKSGALINALGLAMGEYIAILDADFVPPPNFLTAAMPYFLQDERLGFVQARWGYTNAKESTVTRIQALLLDIHFALEKPVEQDGGLFINYNGSAGILRKMAIQASGGWDPQALSDDLDLSFRMQLKGWKGLYLQDLETPGELPVIFYSYAVQQKRWAYGGIQFLRKAWNEILAAPVPLKNRLHVIGMISSYHIFTLLVLQLLLSFPLLRASISPTFSAVALLCLVAAQLLSGALAQQQLYPDWKSRSLYLPAMVFALFGLSVRMAWGATNASLGGKQEFIGTPKVGASDAQGSTTGESGEVYAPQRRLSKSTEEALLSAGEALLAILSALGLWKAFSQHDGLAAVMYLLYMLSFTAVFFVLRFELQKVGGK